MHRSCCAALSLPLWLVACGDDPPQTYGPVLTVDAGKDAATSDASPIDGASDSAKVDAANDASTCNQTTVVLGGSVSTLFGASATGSGSFASKALTGSLAERVAITRIPNGFLAALRASGDSLMASTFTTNWAEPTALDLRKTIDAPAIAAVSSTVQLVYQVADYKYVRTQYASNAWDGTTDPVGVGINQSYGPRGPAVAADGSDLIVLQSGDDSVLHDRALSGGTWTPDHAQSGALVEKSIPPAMVSLTGSGPQILAVYVRQSDFKLMGVTRTNGTWSVPVMIDANAYSNESISVGRAGAGRGLLAYRGSDGKAYFAVFDAAKNPNWTPAAPLGATAPSVESAPSVADGACGADATIAYAVTGGGAQVVSYQASGIGAALPVPGTNGAKWVGVATSP